MNVERINVKARAKECARRRRYTRMRDERAGQAAECLYTRTCERVSEHVET